MPCLSACHTVEAVAARYSVDRDAVIGWIKSGQLIAVDVSRAARAKRKLPRWRVTPEALEAFEATRSSRPQPARSRKQRKLPADVIQFF